MNRSSLAALVGSLVIVLIVAATLHINQLPLIGGGGAGYRAAFADAGGLKVGDPVEVSGVRSGQVTGLRIDQADVIVTFTLKGGVRLGDRTRAAIEIGSLLGSKFLDVEPAGTGSVAAGGLIPLDRTIPAYDLVQAFSTLTTTAEKIDKNQVAKALDTIATTFQNSPQDVHDSLRGLAAFSNTIASRSDEVAALLHRARIVSGLLANRRGDLVTLMQATTQILTELDQRRQALAQLLSTTSTLFDQLRQLVNDNQATLAPALGQVNQVLSTLAARQTELRSIVKNMDIYVRLFTNTLGNGPWFDSVIPNLPTRAVVGR